jgi:hypothetical protein
MNGKGKFGQFSGPAHHFEEPGPSHRSTAFGIEDEAALQVLPPQLPKGPDFLTVSGCVLSTPFLARRTWMRPLSSSIVFQVNSQSSLARNPSEIGFFTVDELVLNESAVNAVAVD